MELPACEWASIYQKWAPLCGIVPMFYSTAPRGQTPRAPGVMANDLVGLVMAGHESSNSDGGGEAILVDGKS